MDTHPYRFDPGNRRNTSDNLAVPAHIKLARESGVIFDDKAKKAVVSADNQYHFNRVRLRITFIIDTHWFNRAHYRNLTYDWRYSSYFISEIFDKNALSI